MFAERIYRKREERGLTQEQVAEQVGVSSWTVADWERGAALPDAEKLEVLAAFYDTTAEELTKKHVKTEHADKPFHGEKKKAADRKAGVTLCFAGAICMVLLLAIMFLLPNVGQQLRYASADSVDGIWLLVGVSAISMITGLLMVLRNQ